jgi:fatty acid desaturase
MRFLAEVSEHMGLEWTTEFGTTRNKLGWVQDHIMHPHGDGYHLVHHLYPQIPHHNLPKAHQLLMQDPVYREKGNHCTNLFFSFHESRTTLGDLLCGAHSGRFGT